MIECLAAFAILQAVNHWLFADQLGFTDANPHPYFFIILLFALRYGFWPGLFSSALGVVLFSVNTGIHLDFHLFSTDMNWGFLRNSVLFLLLGGGVGEATSRIRRHLKIQRDESRKRAKDYDALLDRHQATQRVLDESEKSLAGQMNSLDSLLSISQRFNTVNEKEIHASLLKILEQKMNAQSCSIYRVQDGKLTLEGFCGEKPGLEEIQYDKVSGMWKVSLREKRTVSIAELWKDGGTDGNSAQTMLCGPLTVQGKVVALVDVSKMPFFNLSVSQVKMFDLLTNLVSQKIKEARNFREVKEKQTIDDHTGLLSFFYFKRRMRREYDRAKRNHLPLTLLAVVVENSEEIEEDQAGAIVLTLGNIIQATLRVPDLVASNGIPGMMLCFLDGCGEENLPLVIQRLKEAVHEYSLKSFKDQPDSLRIRTAGISVDPQRVPPEDFQNLYSEENLQKLLKESL